MEETNEVKSCEVLINEFASRRLFPEGEKLIFKGVEGRDVYNITAPFLDKGEKVIAGRVEARDSEFSDVMFFAEEKGVWKPRKRERIFRGLQDPFVTHIYGELVFGGVEIWPNPYQAGVIEYRTVCYRGDSIRDLQLFFVGPQWMKDIRLVELNNGRIGVFTRPNGDYWGGRARIGWTVVENLTQLTPGVIANASILPHVFAEGEWGGVNEVHMLENNRVGVLGHIAYRSQNEHNVRENLHYASMVFVLDLDTLKTSPVQVIANRACFPAGEAKRPELADVIFSGGMVRFYDGWATLYVGVSDAEAHRIKIPDPFDVNNKSDVNSKDRSA